VSATNPRSRSFRGFTFREIEIAKAMRAEGHKRSHIAGALGRRSHDGIRRQLDNAYRQRRNAYHAKRMRAQGAAK